MAKLDWRKKGKTFPDCPYPLVEVERVMGMYGVKLEFYERFLLLKQLLGVRENVAIAHAWHYVKTRILGGLKGKGLQFEIVIDEWVGTVVQPFEEGLDAYYRQFGSKIRFQNAGHAMDSEPARRDQATPTALVDMERVRGANVLESMRWAIAAKNKGTISVEDAPDAMAAELLGMMQGDPDIAKWAMQELRKEEVRRSEEDRFRDDGRALDLRLEELEKEMLSRGFDPGSQPSHDLDAAFFSAEPSAGA